MSDEKHEDHPRADEGWSLGDLTWNVEVNDVGSALIFALVETDFRRGKPVLENAVTVRIEAGAHGSGCNPEQVKELADRIGRFLASEEFGAEPDSLPEGPS